MLRFVYIITALFEDLIQYERDCHNHTDNDKNPRQTNAHIIAVVEKCLKIYTHFVLRSACRQAIYKKKLRISPPAITEAICPDTFTPIECINRKF